MLSYFMIAHSPQPQMDNRKAKQTNKSVFLQQKTEILTKITN